jgi:ATP-dependent Clp protease ATP-binding subunit ClpB
LKYGARHLKRAIERLVVQPMSNLIATDQVRGGDWVKPRDCRWRRWPI